MNEILDKAFMTIVRTKERATNSLIKKYTQICKLVHNGADSEAIMNAYIDFMTETEEMECITKKTTFAVQANIEDLKRTREAIDFMKNRSLEIEQEFERLLKEKEVRTQLAITNSLPTRAALISTHENELEREVKPIEKEIELLEQKLELHKKHLQALWASIQQLEAELESHHEFGLVEG